MKLADDGSQAKLTITINGNISVSELCCCVCCTMFSLGGDIHSDEELDFSTTNSSVSGKDDLAPPSLHHSSLSLPTLHHPILFLLSLLAKHDAPFSFTCKNPILFFFPHTAKEGPVRIQYNVWFPFVPLISLCSTCQREKV
jgi:hypothetical protein